VNIEQNYLDNFWCKSVDCALIVKYIDSKPNIPNPERLFIIGLLHNLAELVVQQISLEKILAVNNFSSSPSSLRKNNMMNLVLFTVNAALNF
jgi:HD-like signal output (HDOD) protein